MAGNTTGTLFRLTTFGESHGAALGGVVDGCPAGLALDEEIIQAELDRRRPGQSELTTPRKEADRLELLSGVFEGRTTGTPIGFVVRNNDHLPADYDALRDVLRPGHADEAWLKKFGLRDHRGSGRASARETLCRVAAGAIAKLLLAQSGTRVQAYVSRVKDTAIPLPWHQLDLSLTDTNPVRCPHEPTAAAMMETIEQAKAHKDSVGGIVTCVCSGMHPGWGEPVFDKLHALMAHAMLSINATRGFELDEGFLATHRFGSENNPRPSGVSGGISTGSNLVFHVAFKPVSTIPQTQHARNVQGQEITFEGTGRHDPCVLPRAVPVVEAMAALVLADVMLMARANRI